MTGYDVDPEALRSAINKLQEAWERVNQLLGEVDRIEPGELTAQDDATQLAYDKFKERAAGSDGSLRLLTESLRDKVHAKIQAYEETLREYEQRDRDALPEKL